jgi:beta-lactamase class A
MGRLKKSICAAFTVICLSAPLPTVATAETVLAAVQGIQHDLSARVGFYFHDLHSGEIVTYAEDDRFPLNSTFKLLACGALLSRAENNAGVLSKRVVLDDLDVVSYSPAIKGAIKSGRQTITLDEACRMMLTISDNTAANAVLSELGGPKGLTNFMRTIGDDVTRLDRWEPALNEATPGDPRDTTTPRAIAYSLQKLLLEDALSATSRATLRDWLSGHSIADALFRASLPATWSIDDRTGAGGYGSRSIIAVMYPPGREPLIVTLFITETDADFDQRNAAAARIGKAIVESVVGK